MGKGTKFQQRIGTKQQSPYDNSPFSCFEYLILYKLVTNALPITYTKRSIWKVCLYTIICIIILLQLFLQPQSTSSLQMTAAASSVTHCGCSCSFLPRVQPQFGGSGRAGLRAVACPHM